MKLYCKKTLAFLLAVLLLTLLFGCAAKNAAAPDYKPDYETAPAMEEPAAEPAPAPEPVPAPASPTDLQSLAGQADGSEEAASARPSLAEKIIYSGYQSIETTEFDKALAALDARVKEVGGFIESASTSSCAAPARSATC